MFVPIWLIAIVVAALLYGRKAVLEALGNLALVVGIPVLIVAMLGGTVLALQWLETSKDPIAISLVWLAIGAYLIADHRKRARSAPPGAPVKVQVRRAVVLLAWAVGLGLLFAYGGTALFL